MNICLLQTDICWNDTKANIRKAEALMEPHYSETRLFLLPEMWSTGFVTNPDRHTGEEALKTREWMKKKAIEHDIYIGGSLPLPSENIPQAEKESFVNRFILIHPDGRETIYDKRHLFSYGGEQYKYLPGHDRMIIDIEGIRTMLQICYDLRFPVFSRNRGDYDMLVYVANWPDSRQQVWQTLLRARAIENQCYVCGVNRVGNDPSCHYMGGSAIIDAYGHTLQEAGDKECVLKTDIDLEKLAAFRKKFAVLRDADTFSLTE